jgi:hypothetical protein
MRTGSPPPYDFNRTAVRTAAGVSLRDLKITEEIENLSMTRGIFCFSDEGQT